jgi:eukaryotic-like serine/threonine-protein kinase
MNGTTGRPTPETRDTRIFDSDAENENATKTLSMNESTAKTVEIGDAAQRKHIVGSRVSGSGIIGGYQIVRKIGEGGMGVVYEAEQQTPRRRVALKVIRGGPSASDYHLRMFEREIQALARLRHPGIVSIYEAGRFDDGQVFFAMELLQGESLIDFVDARESTRPLAVNEKLRLFAKVCEIVSYAHQRGVIHRDLKPGNIYVADDGFDGSQSGTSDRSSVKVLDFGLARITDPDPGGATDVSQIGHIKGTLSYMSPEQLTGNPADIDVRSDVYALGVILYEILSGRLPYDISRAPVPVAMRMISQDSPAPLSRSMKTSIADGRRTVSKVDADIETIVFKALEKEPERRYQSAAAMLEDVTRYLSDQPILARPPSAVYQFKKLVLRHKTASASLAGLFLMLLAFGAVMAAQNARITSERNRAWVAQQLAEEQGIQADEARDSEQKQRLIAEQNLFRAEEQQRIAEREKSEAERARKAEEEQRLVAENSLRQARQEKDRAERQTGLARKQEVIANEQRSLAEKRETEAEEQRKAALASSEANRRLLYNAQMNLAGQAWEQADVQRMQQLLESQIPKPGETDLRGFEWYHAWKLANSEQRSFRLNAISAQYVDGGKLLVINEYEKLPDNNAVPAVRVVQPETGREVARSKGRLFIGADPAGRLMTIGIERLRQLGSEGRTSVEFMDPHSGVMEPSAFTVPKDSFNSISPDGRFIAERVSSGTMVLKEIATGRELHTFTTNGYLFSPEFSEDGRFLALIDSDRGVSRRVIVWDSVSNTLHAELGKSDGSDFRAVAVSPGGKLLASRNFDGTLTVWDLAKKTKRWGSEKDELEKTFGGGMSRLVFSPDGRMIAETIGRAVKLWLPVGSRIIKGSGEPAANVAFSPDSRNLAVVARGGSVKVWDIPSLAARGINGFQSSLAADARTLAVSVNGGVKFWDIRENRELYSFAQSEARSRPSDVAISPDGRRLALIRLVNPESPRPELTNPDSELELWDVERREKIRSIEKGARKAIFSPDGHFLAVVNGKGSVMIDDFEVALWDVTAGTRVASLGKGHSVEFSPDGRLIAVGHNHIVRLLEAGTLREIGTLPKQQLFGLVDRPITFSPTGKLIATNFENEVFLWDTATRAEIGALKGHSDNVSSIDFSPDGRRIVTASNQDGTIRVWDVETQSQLMTFRVDHPNSARFSSDGQFLLVVTRDGIRAWRAASQDEVSKQLADKR